MKKIKYILCALTLLMAGATAHAQVFDVTITPADGSEVFTKTNATRIEIIPSDASPIHVFSGKSEEQGTSLTIAHDVRYDITLTPVNAIRPGQDGGLPEGNFAAQAPHRTAEAPSFTEPTLTGPALVLMREDKDPIIYYADGETIKLKCNANGEYVVGDTKVQGTVTNVFYKDAHVYDNNGFCTHSPCDKPYLPATQVTAENYASLGFTADNYSAYQYYYAISNAGQLYWFAANTNNDAVLTADIVVNESVFDEGGILNEGPFRAWTPFSLEETTFDGNGHTISGLYYHIIDGNDYYAGLVIDNISGTIKNLGVKDSYFNVNIEGDCHVGGVCSNNNGTITNCYATDVMVWGDYAGGVCGFNYDFGTITNCYATHVSNGESVINGMHITGVCGRNFGTITNCYTDHETPVIEESGSVSNVETMSEEFASGEVCYLLNGSVNDQGTWTAGTGTPTWYQRLGEGGDSSPVLKAAEDGSNTVYYGYEYECNSDVLTYANRQLYDEANKPHTDANTDGFCDVCGKGIEVTVTLSRVGDRYYTSFGAPYIYNVKDAGDNLKVYVATSLSEGVLTMTQVADATIAADKGVVIVGTSSSSPETMTATIAPATTADVETDLLGATTADMETTGKAFFSAVNGIVGFFAYNSENGAVPAGKAYLDLAGNAVSADAPLRLEFEDETTGISHVNANDIKAGTMYNLQGQRLIAPQKGLNVINGEKVMVK